MASVMGEGDSTRITKMLKDTVILLCENSLSFTSELHVQALLAISVDHSTMFAVQVDEKLTKNKEERVGGSASSGSAEAQGRLLSEKRPVVARRLALPAPPTSSNNDGDGIAWTMQAVRAVRTQGPRFPVGRGRGIMRGRGRGGRGAATVRGGTVQGGAPAVRMIRTAVSSVRFPVSRPRMQMPHRAARPVSVRPPQRLALPPATRNPRQVPPVNVRHPTQRLALPPATGSQVPTTTAVVRHEAPVPMRQTMSPASTQRPVSQAVMRKPSPRLAVMPPPSWSVSTTSAVSGLRQQSPSMSPRQAGSVRASCRRPRLAIMPSLQQSLSGNSQSLVLRSPTQPRAMPSQSSPRLALMPPSKSPVRSPCGTRPHTAATLHQSLPAKPQVQLVARPQSLQQQSPAVVKQESSLSLCSSNMERLVSQLSSSSAGTQLHAMVERLSKQQRQPSPAKQSTQIKSAATVTMPAVLPHSLAIQSAPVSLTNAATVRPVITLNLSHAGNLQTSSIIAAGTKSPGTSSRPMHDTGTLFKQSSLPQCATTPMSMPQSLPQYASMPMPIAITQQRVVMTSPSSNTCQAVGRAASISSFQTSLHQPNLMTQTLSGIISAHPNITAQHNSITGAQRFVLQSPGVTSPMATPSKDMVNTSIQSPYAQFSVARQQPVSSQLLTALPLYRSPSQITAVQQADAGDMHQRACGILQQDVMVPGSPFGMDRAAGSNASVTDVQRHAANSAVKQLLLSPQPHLPRVSVGYLQQHVMSQFSPQQQQQQPPSASQTYFSPSSMMDDVTRTTQQFSSPLTSHMSAAVLQQRSPNSPQVSSLTQNQISAAYAQEINRHVASVAQSQLPVTSVQQRRQNPQQVTVLQSQMPAAALQQFMLKPREAVVPAQGQMFPRYVPKWTQNPQQASASMSAASMEQRSQNLQHEDQILNKVASIHQPMEYHQQITSSSTPSQMFVQCCQSPHDTSRLSSSERMRATVSQSVGNEPQSVTSLSNAQVAVGSMDSEQMAILEIIKRQACEQLKRSIVQQKTVSATSGSDQVTASRQVTLTSVPQQTVSAALGSDQVTASRQVTLTLQQSSSRSGQMTLNTPQQTVALSSRHFQLTSLGLPRQTVPRASSHVEAFLTTNTPRQAVVSASNHNEQVASPAFQFKHEMSELGTTQLTSSTISSPAVQQHQVGEHRTPQCMSSSTSTLQSHSSHFDKSMSLVGSSSATVQDNAVPASSSMQHNTPVTKEKLLKLKEKILKTGSVEHDRQKIISSQLLQLQSDVATDDDVERSSRGLVAQSSVSSTSLARRSEPGE